jgi:hypothetical protein
MCEHPVDVLAYIPACTCGVWNCGRVDTLAYLCRREGGSGYFVWPYGEGSQGPVPATYMAFAWVEGLNPMASMCAEVVHCLRRVCTVLVCYP